MKLSRGYFVCIAAGLAAFCGCNISVLDRASAQTRTLKVVVTFPPRSGADILTRTIVEQFGKAHGTTTIVENSSAVAGMDAVAQAPADGETLLVTNNNFEVDSHFRKLSFDPLTDFEPICKLATAQGLIVVSTSSPYQSISDVVRASQGNPMSVTMAAAPASVVHMGVEILKHVTKADMTFVPVPGAGPQQLQAVLDGRASITILNYQNSLPHLNSGKLRALAVTTRKRLEALPNVPTVAESGYDYDLAFWDGVFAPAKTSKERTSQLATWFREALNDPGVRATISREAFVPDVVCGADFAATIRKEHDQFGSVIREANIKP